MAGVYSQLRMEALSSLRLNPDVPPRRFALDPAAGNVFAFTFAPGDFGIADLSRSVARDPRWRDPSHPSGRASAPDARERTRLITRPATSFGALVRALV
jgi:hypothetical protein